MPTRPRPLTFAAQAGLLAAAYWLAAVLSLQLAIPPGYATPIWPASGIALAGLLILGGRAWIGVWLGSFAANAGVDAAFVVPAVIATGSALQAAVAAAVPMNCRRFSSEVMRVSLDSSGSGGSRRVTGAS